MTTNTSSAKAEGIPPATYGMNGYVVVDGTEIAAFVQEMYGTRSTPKRQQVEQIVEDFLVWRFKKNGPAEAATSPSRGSQSPKGQSNMATDTTGADARQDRDPIRAARDKLSRIKDLNELVFLAGEGMLGMSRKSANAICAGCDTIGDLLEEVCDLIDGRHA